MDNDRKGENDKEIPGLLARIESLKADLGNDVTRLDDLRRAQGERVDAARAALGEHQGTRSQVLNDIDRNCTASRFVLQAEAVAKAFRLGGSEESQQIAFAQAFSPWMIVGVITVIQYILAFALESLGGFRITRKALAPAASAAQAEAEQDPVRVTARAAATSCKVHVYRKRVPEIATDSKAPEQDEILILHNPEARREEAEKQELGILPEKAVVMDRTCKRPFHGPRIAEMAAA